MGDKTLFGSAGLSTQYLESDPEQFISSIFKYTLKLSGDNKHNPTRSTKHT